MNTLGDWDGHIPTFAVQSLSCVRLLVIPWTAAHQAPLSSTISCSLLKLMSIKSVMLSSPLCCPLLLLPTNFPSIRVFFQWVSTLHHVTRVLELQLQHQSFQWILRVDSLSDWLDSLAVQGTLQSLLQHHNSKASILQHSAFFMIKLPHHYGFSSGHMWMWKLDHIHTYKMDN